MSNYATKANLKNVTGADTSDFAKKNVATNLNNLKNKVNKLDVDKLVPVHVDLSGLSAVVENVVKNDLYNAKIKNIEDKITWLTMLLLMLK